MYLLLLGLILAAMKLFGVGPVAGLSWWWVALPFGLTVLWWSWADKSGYTMRKQQEREDARKAARVQRQRERMGLGEPKDKP